MSARITWVIIGLVAVAVLGSWVVTDVRTKQTLRDALAQNDSLRRSAARVVVRYDTLVRRDTIVLTRELPRYHAVHDTVLAHLTDTVLVKQFVNEADTTIHACTRALGDCEQLAAGLRLQVAAEHARGAALARLQPTFVQKHVGWVAVGAAVVGLYFGARLR